MLKLRIIPTLLFRQFGLVKGVSFSNDRQVGPIMPAVKVYCARDVDELAVFDVNAYRESKEPNYALVQEISKECFVPLTIGGGITRVEQIEKLLEAGADKVSINSALFKNPSLINDAATRFGSQCVIASIDVMRNDDYWICKFGSGTIDSAKNPCQWAKELEERGAGEILVTSIDNDGTMNGYDIELIQMVSESVKIPLIAGGGAGSAHHLIELFKNTSVSAAALASLFHFTQVTPNEIKRELLKAGFPVRLDL